MVAWSLPFPPSSGVAWQVATPKCKGLLAAPHVRRAVCAYSYSGAYYYFTLQLHALPQNHTHHISSHIASDILCAELAAHVVRADHVCATMMCGHDVCVSVCWMCAGLVSECVSCGFVQMGDDGCARSVCSVARFLVSTRWAWWCGQKL